MQPNVQTTAYDLADTAPEELNHAELVNMAYNLLKQLNENDRNEIIAEVIGVAV